MASETRKLMMGMKLSLLYYNVVPAAISCRYAHNNMPLRPQYNSALTAAGSSRGRASLFLPLRKSSGRCIITDNRQV